MSGLRTQFTVSSASRPPPARSHHPPTSAAVLQFRFGPPSYRIHARYVARQVTPGVAHGFAVTSENTGMTFGEHLIDAVVLTRFLPLLSVQSVLRERT